MKERPILVAVIGYIIGILMGLYFEFSIVPFYLPIIIIYLLLRRYLNKKQKFKLISFHRYLRYIKLFINTKVILILIISSFISNSIVLIQNTKYNSLFNDNQELSLKGVVISNKEEKQYNDVYKIKVKNIGNFYIRVNKNIENNFEYGDEIYIKGCFESPSSQRNEGGFDYKQYLKTLKIYGTINIENTKLVKSKKVNVLFRLSNEISVKLKNNIDAILKKEEASILKGLLLGDISDIDDKLYEKFQISNITHILAVSGMHVSYIVIGINLLLKERIGKRKIKFLLIIFLILYMFITGFSPSIVRATIMNILIIFSGIVYRKNDILTSISFSLLLILIYNPFLILNIGLKLSYLGTISIILFNKDISSILEDKLKIKNSKIKSILSVVLSAQIGILPIVLYEFNYIGIYFIITNLIVSIIIGPIILIGILFTILSVIYTSICQKISFLLEIPIKLLIQISNFSKLPFAKFYISTPKIWMIIFYYIFILSSKILYNIYHKKKINSTEHRMKNLLSLIKFKFNNRKKQLKKIRWKIGMVIIIYFMIILSFNSISSNLKIYFLDVGQGDCTLIVTPQNKTILIDGGGSESPNFDVGKRTLIPFILDKGYTKIDYIIISHFDQDHVGGILTIMEELKVGQVIISKQGEDSENYKKFKEIVMKKKIKVLVVEEGNKVQIEKNLYFDFLWPNNEKLIQENILNNNSIVCKLGYKHFSMLFTGDIEEIAEKQILNYYKNNTNILNSTILKVGHHGSKTSSIQEFIEAIKPKIALIGVGANNKFGHPSDEVIERIEKHRY